MNDKSRISDEQIIYSLSTSKSVKEALESLGLKPYSKSYLWIKNAATRLELELPIFERGTPHIKYSIEEILVENSPYSGGQMLKKRLIKAGILEDKCVACGIPPHWNGKSLTLQLDHINGVNDDNRIENLRILCPNCHSQTDTFCGRKSPTKPQLLPKNNCSCGKEKLVSSTQCITCARENALFAPHIEYRIEWPDDEELIGKLKVSSFEEVSRQLGVSSNAIRKRLKRKGLFPIDK